MKPSCCWSLLLGNPVRFAKPKDRLRVVKTTSSCCCKLGEVVEVVGCSARGDITIKCPVFGEHEFGYAYNQNFEFEEEE